MPKSFKKNREKLLWDLIFNVRSNVNIDKIKMNAVRGLSEFFAPDRCTIIEYDQNQHTIPIDKNSEYLASPNSKSLVGIDLDEEYDFGVMTNALIEMHLKQNKNFIYIPCASQFIKDSNLSDSKLAKYCAQSDFSTCVGISIFEKNKIKMFFSVKFKKQRDFSEEDIEFIKVYAEQVYLSIKQNRTIKMFKTASDRQKLMQKTVKIIRSSLDIQKITGAFVFELGKQFGASRAIFAKYDSYRNVFFTPDASSEYLISPDMKLYREYGRDFDASFKFFSEKTIATKKMFVMNDREEFIKKNNLEGTEDAKNLRSENICALITVPVLYRNKLFGVYVFNYEAVGMFTPEDIDFIVAVAEQTSVAIYQAELFAKNKKQVDQEKMMRKIVNIIRGSLDVQQITSSFVFEMGKKVGVYRAFFSKFDAQNNVLLTPDENSEYLSSSDAIRYSVLGRDFGDAYPFFMKKLIKNKKNIIIKDREEFVRKYNIEGSQDHLNLIKFEAGSTIIIPVIYKDTMLGVYTFSFKESNLFTQEDIDFIISVSDQTAIALYQAEMFSKVKRQAKNEALLRKIITKAASTLEMSEIKKMVRDIGRVTKADRCFFVEVDTDRMTGAPIDSDGEYLASNEVESLVGYEFPPGAIERFLAFYLRSEDIGFLDYDKVREENKPEYQGVIEYGNRFNIKSGLGIPFYYMGKLYAVLSIEYIQTKILQTSLDLEFLRFVAKQVGVAFRQIKLYQEEKQTAEREKLLRDIITTTRSSLNIQQIKKTIVTEILKTINADSVSIFEYDATIERFLMLDDSGETFSRPGLPSLKGEDINSPPYKFFADTYRAKKEIVFYDVQEFIKENNLEGTPPAAFFEQFNIKSALSIPIVYGDELLGCLSITFLTENRFKEEQLVFVRTLSGQIAIALFQSRLFEKEKQAVEREKMLNKIILTIRSSLGLKEIKQKIVEELGKILSADRCYLRSFDIEKKLFLPPDAEYLASDDIKSLKNVEPDQEGLHYFFQQVELQDGIYPIEVTEDFIAEHHLHNKALDRYFKQANIKSDFAIPVWSKKGELSFLVLHYIKKSFHLSEDLKQLMVLLSRQISIALEQADLYSELKSQAEREKISRKTVDIIRSSLDIDQILISVSKELMGIFNVQRIFAGRINFIARENFVEVTSSEDIKSFTKIGGPIYDAVAIFWEDYIRKTKKTLVIQNIEEADIPPAVKNSYINMEVKSIVCVPIKSQDEIWGGIFLSSTDKYRKWTNEEVAFLESIVTQLDAAIRQAELYTFQKKTAYKESVLRNIISELKLTRNLKQAYDTLLQKLAEVFNLNRVLFLESSTIVPEALSTKNEYVLDREDLSANNLIFPQVCLEKFFNLVHHLKTLTINDVLLCHPKSTLDFFEKYKIRAMMAVPLVKYNREVKVLGFIVLCSEEKRIWTEAEVDLINSISESVVSVIWEISKFIEIEDLRNSFVLTLAHDFQVPLIGEKLAIEYLLENSNDVTSKNKELLSEILENNNNIITLLNKSVDIYNYDAGKKVIILDVYEIYDVLNNAVYLQENTNSKLVNIELAKSSKSLFVKIDKKELLKVLSTLLENAIDHTPQGESVKIRYYSQNKRVIISVHNEGAAISKETQEIIFNRYEMALAIERKIGAGTGLFLAKKIVEAHKGNIWFDTSDDEGTTFYISLPQVEIKHV